MSRLLASLVCALAIMTISPTGGLAHEPSPPAITSADPLAPAARQAAAAVDAFHSALDRGDTAAAADLLADDAMIFEEGFVERSKAEYAASHLAADAAYSAAVPSTVTRRSGGAAQGVAWIATEGRSTGRFGERAVDRVTTETIVLKRSAHGWRIVHIHWSSRNATP